MLKRGEMDERMFIPVDVTAVYDETRDGITNTKRMSPYDIGRS